VSSSVEGEFAMAGVATDEQPVISGLGGQGDPRPVVVALSLGTSAGREPLPGTLGQVSG
jgi:hypothetical protein